MIYCVRTARPNHIALTNLLSLSIQRVLHSNLSARVILNLHEASFLEKKEQYSSMNFQLTSLRPYERGEGALGTKMGTWEIQLA